MDHQYIIRPHHGMCIAFFQGKGYSNDFTSHMNEMIQKLDNATVCISVQTDAICRKCPNNMQGTCKTEDKVISYDKKVLELCGLSDGAIMSFKNFYNTVHKNILSTEKREEICGDCQWNELCK